MLFWFFRLFLPDRLYRDFALLATLKPDGRRETSYLFAVVNPLDTLVQFGLKVAANSSKKTNLSSKYIYTDWLNIRYFMQYSRNRDKIK